MNRSRIDRTTVRVPGFDPDNAKHVAAVEEKVARKAGPGFKVVNFDPSTSEVTFERGRMMTQVSDEEGVPRKTVNLRAGLKPSDGDKEAARLEDQYPGYFMTRFEPYLMSATLEQLTDDLLHARGAIANALGVKPWEVSVAPRKGGGVKAILPKSYVPSRHDEKLDEVATRMIGRDGWYVEVDPRTLEAEVVPAEPPTFPAAIPYPFDMPVSDHPDERLRVPLGEILPERAEREREILYLDLDASPHTAINGISGAGKTVTINAAIYGALIRGMKLAIIDVPAKKVDFLWAKKFCAPGFWGCDSLEASVATMGMIYEEGLRRAEILEEYGVVKVAELPEGKRFPEIFVVVDELTGLFMPEEVPKLPKDDPIRIEAEEINSLKARLKRNIKRTAAELRFVGIKLTLSTQVASANTGITPDLRTNLGNRCLLGAKPTDGNRSLALNDPAMVPKVPANVQNDGKARRGVGVFEFEGRQPGVLKSYYADAREYGRRLTELGITQCASPAPTPHQIAQHTGGGQLADTPAGQDDPWNGRRVPKAPEDQMYDENGKPLRGAAAAAKAAKQAAQTTRDEVA